MLFLREKNVRENIKSSLSTEIYKKIEEDLTKIHMSHSKENFEKNKAEFKTKYKKNYGTAYKYCSGWFEGMRVYANWQERVNLETIPGYVLGNIG